MFISLDEACQHIRRVDDDNRHHGILYLFELFFCFLKMLNSFCNFHIEIFLLIFFFCHLEKSFVKKFIVGEKSMVKEL